MTRFSRQGEQPILELLQIILPRYRRTQHWGQQTVAPAMQHDKDRGIGENCRTYNYCQQKNDFSVVTGDEKEWCTAASKVVQHTTLLYHLFCSTNRQAGA